MDVGDLITKNKWSQIYKGIKQEKIDPLKSLGHNGNTVIHMASVNNDKKIISYCLKHNIKALKKSNNDGNTPIHLLATYAYVEPLKECIKVYPSFLSLLNNKNENITNILYNNYELIKDACSYDINLIKDDIEHNNIIYKNIDDGNIKILDLLLKNQKTYIDNYKDSFLAYALKNIQPEVATLFIENGYDINKLNKSYISPLMYAIKNKMHDIIQLLLINKVDLAYNGPEGNNNLMVYAILNNDEKAINMLLDAGFNINTYDQDKNTPLHFALKNKNLNLDTLISLIYHGNLNIQNNRGITPLHELCQNFEFGNFKKVLKQKPMDIYIKDSSGKRPTDYLNGHSANKFMDLVIKSYYKNIDKKKFPKCQSNLHSQECYYELKKYILSTKRSIPEKKDCKELKIKFIATPKANHGLFNSDAIHNMIYTICMLEKYPNIIVPFQYLSYDKYINTKISWNNLYKSQGDGMVYELAQTYNDYFFEIQPYLLIWKNKNVHYVHKDLKFLMKKCLNSKNLRYIFIKLTLIPTDYNTHANIIVYDKDKDILERFEPYGEIPYLDGPYLNNWIEDIGKRCISKTLTFIKPVDMNSIGLQTLSDDSNFALRKLGDPVGYCLAWTFWFLESRILNPNVSSHNLVTGLISKVSSEKGLINFIRDYSITLDNAKNKFMENAGIPNYDLYDMTLDNHNFNKVLKALRDKFDDLVKEKID